MPRRKFFRRGTHWWLEVRSQMICFLGREGVPAPHYVVAGKWMRFRRDDHGRLGSCEDCLRVRNVERPLPKPRKVVMNFDEDVRAKRAGDQ